MSSKERGFTLIEIVIALILLGTVFAFSFKALGGVNEIVQLRAVSEQAQDLVNYVERIRKTASSTTVGSPTYPGGSPNTHTYMTLPAGSTVADFRAEYLNEFGTTARLLPSESPFETPYLIAMTNETSFVEVTVPFTDATLKRAQATINGSETIFRFYPTVETENSGTDRSAGSSFTKSFVQETVR